jgi:hypothetical protein
MHLLQSAFEQVLNSLGISFEEINGMNTCFEKKLYNNDNQIFNTILY